MFASEQAAIKLAKWLTVRSHFFGGLELSVIAGDL